MSDVSEFLSGKNELCRIKRKKMSVFISALFCQQVSCWNIVEILKNIWHLRNVVWVWRVKKAFCAKHGWGIHILELFYAKSGGFWGQTSKWVCSWKIRPNLWPCAWNYIRLHDFEKCVFCMQNARAFITTDLLKQHHQVAFLLCSWLVQGLLQLDKDHSPKYFTLTASL